MVSNGLGELESLATAAGEAVQEAWEGGGEFKHVVSIGGETYVDYAAMEGRAAPLPEYAKLLASRQLSDRSALGGELSGGFTDAIGGLRPGRTAGYERVYPDRTAPAPDGSPTDLYTERPIQSTRQPAVLPPNSALARVDREVVSDSVGVGDPGSANLSVRQTSAAMTATVRRHKVVPARAEARSHAAQEQAARDSETEALSAKAAYQSEINAVRRNVAADRAARQAAERRMQAATTRAEQLKRAEEAAAAAAAAVQRELAIERELRSKAEARARVLSQKVAAASKAKARSEAKAKAQEREKLQTAKRTTTHGAKRRTEASASGVRASGGQPRGKHLPTPDATQDVQPVQPLKLQAGAVTSNDEFTWAAPRGPVVREIRATIPTAAKEEAQRASARPSVRQSAQSESVKLRQSGSGTARPGRSARKPSLPTSQENAPRSASRARQRAAEQEARTIERLRASAQNRAVPQTDYEHIPEGPPKKKTSKKKAKKWPKPRPVKSRPLPDWSAVPAKVSTRPDNCLTDAHVAAGSAGDDVSLPASERLMRRALEQEERTVARLRKNQHSGNDDGGNTDNGTREKMNDQQQRRWQQNRGMPMQRNFLARGTAEERLAAQAEDARRRATRYKNAVNRLSSIAQAVDDVERQQATERQRLAREKDNGVNARDHWRTAGPVRLDPDGCIVLEGPEADAIRPRARSAPARPRPVQPKNTSPPGYIKRMQQREMKAKASRPGEGGIHAWKQSLRESESQGKQSHSGEPGVTTRNNWLRKGGGHRALDGKVYGSESQCKQPDFDAEDTELATVLPGKIKSQSGLAAKWAHVPSRIRGQKPWQGRHTHQQLASTEDMVDEAGQPLVEIMFEVGSIPPRDSERDSEEAEMRNAAEVFRDQGSDALQEETEHEQWARYAIEPSANESNEGVFMPSVVSCRGQRPVIFGRSLLC